MLSIRLAAACLGIERLKVPPGRSTRQCLRASAHSRHGSVSRSVRVFESTIVRVPTVVVLYDR